MSTPTAPPSVDPLARQLAGGFLASLLLVPLRAVLETTSYGAVWLWVLGAVAGLVAVGWLLRLVGIPYGVATATAAGGFFLPLTVIGMGLVSLGDPGDDAAVTLMVGVPAAALAALLAALAIGRSQARTAAAVSICAIGVLVAGAMGPEVYDSVDDAREAAGTVAALEASDLEPLIPEIDSFTPTRASTSMSGTEAVSYSLTYESETDDVPGTEQLTIQVVSNDVGNPIYQCDSAGSDECAEADGYRTFSSDGAVDRIVSDRGALLLVADLDEPTAHTMPSPEELGAAMAEAEPVEWDDVVGLDD